MSIATYLAGLLNASGLLPVSKINATGTPGASNFLRGDGSWNAAGGITSGTAVATTSGTSIDFTGIPSTARRVTLMFSGFSTSGTSLLRMQLGAGSIDTGATYLGDAVQIHTGATGSTFAGATGFDVMNNFAACLLNGIATFTLVGSNTWVFNFVGGSTGQQLVLVSGGSKALSGALDRVRITTVNGTDTFDAGSVNIIWE